MIRVHVHPGARRTAIQGFRADGSLSLAVTEAPEGGRANRAVEILLAGALDVPRTSVAVVQGAGSRRKTVRIAGLSAADVHARIDRVADGRP